MKIQPNYMYRVLGDLQKEGKVKKKKPAKVTSHKKPKVTG